MDKISIPGTLAKQIANAILLQVEMVEELVLIDIEVVPPSISHPDAYAVVAWIFGGPKKVYPYQYAHYVSQDDGRIECDGY